MRSRKRLAPQWRQGSRATDERSAKPLVGCSQDALAARNRGLSEERPQVEEGSTHSKSKAGIRARSPLTGTAVIKEPQQALGSV